MRILIGSAALVLSMILLSGCLGADERASGDISETVPSPEVTIQTAPESPEPSSASEPKPEPEPEPEETEPPEIEYDRAVQTDEELGEEPDSFALPEEFYTQIQELIERYGLNPNCDGSDECLCNPEFEELDAEGNVVTPRERCISIYYRDILSGFEFELNPGAHYPIASSVKIPFCTMIYEKLSAGELDPETVLTYEERHYFEGSGVIVEGDFGQQFTIRELLGLAITRSDNVAYEMLKDLVSWDDFSAYLAEAGCTHPQDVRRSKQKLCTESAGAYGRILADYLRSDPEDGFVELYKEDLLNTRVKMLVSDYPIYRKYGWTNFAFHDIGYVDAPRPYILGVLTNFTGDGPDDYRIFREISGLVEEFSQPENSGE